MCFYCKGDVKPGTTTFTTTIGNCTVVIKNVPCEECTQCGAVEYSDEVMKRIDIILSRLKELTQEVSVIDYRSAA